MRVLGSRRLFPLLLVGLCIGVGLVSDKSGAAESLEPVQSLAQAGKLEEAYQLLLQKPESSAVDFYNIGTLAFRSGHMGQAIGYLEKAKHLRPHDPDIRHNLDIVRTSLSRTLGSEDRLDPASTWTEKLAEHISLDELRGVLGLLTLALFLIWTRSYLRSHRFKTCLLEPSSILGITTLLLVTGMYFVERDAADRPPAIALGRLSIRSGPGMSFAELTEIDPGVKLRVVGRATQAVPPQDSAVVPSLVGTSENSAQASPTPSASGPTGPWYQVRYSTEEVGWVPTSSVMVIE